MNICVCVKQVPDTSEIRIDPEKHTLIRAGVPAVLNPFDAYALEAAVRLKEASGGTVTVLSMGPMQARETLRHCLSVGADEAYLISGNKFGGSDTLATSYILSRAVRTVEKEKNLRFDLILCGKQAVDGDTAQVGPEIAERMDLAQVTCALDIRAEEEGLHIRRENEMGYDILRVKLPALVTVSRLPFEPRYASLRSRLQAKKKEITVLSPEDLDEIDPARCGLNGSPTKVKATYVPVREKRGVIFQNLSPQDAAETLADLLSPFCARKEDV